MHVARYRLVLTISTDLILLLENSASHDVGRQTGHASTPWASSRSGKTCSRLKQNELLNVCEPCFIDHVLVAHRMSWGFDAGNLGLVLMITFVIFMLKCAFAEPLCSLEMSEAMASKHHASS